jgi:hypothetical protein
VPVPFRVLVLRGDLLCNRVETCRVEISREAFKAVFREDLSREDLSRGDR